MLIKLLLGTKLINKMYHKIESFYTLANSNYFGTIFQFCLIVDTLFCYDNLFCLIGLQAMSVEDLMKSHVITMQDGGGYICLICGKQMGFNIRRHLREIHLSSGKEYFCPECDKYFKNKQAIYQHVTKTHKDWKNMDYTSLSVKS